MTPLLFAVTLLGFQAPPEVPAIDRPIDNQRVQVRETDGAIAAVPIDSVWVSQSGHAAFLPKGTAHKADGKGILIGLKDFKVAPLVNKSSIRSPFRGQV